MRCFVDGPILLNSVVKPSRSQSMKHRTAETLVGGVRMVRWIFSLQLNDPNLDYLSTTFYSDIVSRSARAPMLFIVDALSTLQDVSLWRMCKTMKSHQRPYKPSLLHT